MYFWNAITACFVVRPYEPSTAPVQKSSSTSRCWMRAVSPPLLEPTADSGTSSGAIGSMLRGPGGRVVTGGSGAVVVVAAAVVVGASVTGTVGGGATVVAGATIAAGWPEQPWPRPSQRTGRAAAAASGPSELLQAASAGTTRMPIPAIVSENRTPGRDDRRWGSLCWPPFRRLPAAFRRPAAPPHAQRRWSRAGQVRAAHDHDRRRSSSGTGARPGLARSATSKTARTSAADVAGASIGTPSDRASAATTRPRIDRREVLQRHRAMALGEPLAVGADDQRDVGVGDARQPEEVLQEGLAGRRRQQVVAPARPGRSPGRHRRRRRPGCRPGRHRCAAARRRQAPP